MFFPCLTFPCRNGGSCENGPELKMFSCICPLEIKALPYIDNKCNVGKYDYNNNDDSDRNNNNNNNNNTNNNNNNNNNNNDYNNDYNNDGDDNNNN